MGIPCILFPALIAMACLGCSAPASVQAAPPGQAPSEAVRGTVKGILRQVGNHPHVELVVSGESAAFGKGDYFLAGPRAAELATQPLGPIAIQGKIRRTALRLAGKSGGTRIRLTVEVEGFTR